ncbi:MAG: hypothetical protein Q8N79_03865 [Candidatus Methanoperedens sp.]|nr:hypothetical protein [Candidatus Methanoperedens sp.]
MPERTRSEAEGAKDAVIGAYTYTGQQPAERQRLFIRFYGQIG